MFLVSGMVYGNTIQIRAVREMSIVVRLSIAATPVVSRVYGLNGSVGKMTGCGTAWLYAV